MTRAVLAAAAAMGLAACGAHCCDRARPVQRLAECVGTQPPLVDDDLAESCWEVATNDACQQSDSSCDQGGTPP